MLSTDRTEFESQLGKLCAGFNVPTTQDRIEAYWSGLARMSLLQFVRCVEFALGEDGPEKIPTTSGMWKIHRAARTRSVTHTQNVPLIEDKDHLLYFANRLFFRHLVNRGGLGSAGRFVPAHGLVDCKASPELLAARKVVRDLVAWFEGPVRESDPDATPFEFVTQLIAGLKAVGPIDQRTLNSWQATLKHPDARQPFAPFMGRELPVVSQQELVVT
jgi:hypothetical protein